MSRRTALGLAAGATMAAAVHATPRPARGAAQFNDIVALDATALAVPAGFSDEALPIGIQLVGPNRQEFNLLQLAYAYESTLGAEHHRLPPLLHPA